MSMMITSLADLLTLRLTLEAYLIVKLVIGIICMRWSLPPDMLQMVKAHRLVVVGFTRVVEGRVLKNHELLVMFSHFNSHADHPLLSLSWDHQHFALHLVIFLLAALMIRVRRNSCLLFSQCQAFHSSTLAPSLCERVVHWILPIYPL